MRFDGPAPSLRPYLSVIRGQLVVEPVPGLAFPVLATQVEVQTLLTLAAADGLCEARVARDDGVTVFQIRSPSDCALLVYDDRFDGLITVIRQDTDERVMN